MPRRGGRRFGRADPSDGAGGAHRGASCVLVKAPFWEVGFLFLEYHSFVGKCTPISFVGMHPPLLFLRVRRKRRAPCTVEKKKRALQQTCYNLVSILLHSFAEHGAAWCSVVTLPVLLTALRAGAGLGICVVWCISFCCASIVQVCRDALRQGCFVVLPFPLLLRNVLCGCVVENVPFY